ncbi:MAG: dTDP-4-dehydrorhamnose reductase [Tannerellaceae bacterium]|jgi:dTDP-4-dehydrorhamnose reductase|nr:dTDP-4-dehydrorhamnose reductase [Tannerellaceae bacterium]
MKKILITGANGQLGRTLQSLSYMLEGASFLFTDVDTLDICSDEAISAFITENTPVDYIVNCAAYTAVDKAEDDEPLCLRINSDAVRNLGEAAARSGAKIIHISTDYVFDGTNSVPYLETDYTCPMSAYGRSKHRGELLLRAVCPDAVILRTSWLYSGFGSNFVKTMLRLGKEQKEVNVVFDQIGSPTFSVDLAKLILQLILKSEGGHWHPGIYHYSNEGVCSWYDFARKIFELTQMPCLANPINTKDFPTRASRPHFSVLDKGKIKRTYDLKIPHWEDSLKRALLTR